MSWQSAHDVLKGGWTEDPREFRMRDVPACYPCGLCPDSFFTTEARLEHRQQTHGVEWPHGIRARYHAGCRCRPCRRANADYVAELRRGATA